MRHFIGRGQMLERSQSQLIHYLQDELALSADSIAFACRFAETPVHQLAIILWQYGLITIDQLDRLLEWLETV